MTLTRFEKDGVELIIDSSNGESFASIRGYARMSGKAQSTIQSRVDRMPEGERNKKLKFAEIQTPGGLQGVRLIPADIVFEWLFQDNPPLARAMGIAGATVYMHQLAGYKVESKLPEVKPMSTAQMFSLQARVNEEYEARLSEIESKIQVFENRAAEAEKELKALPPATTPCPARTTRNNINTLVRGYCHTNNISHRIAWNNLYREFRDRYHFDLKTRANNRGNSSPLDIAESFNKIDELYSLAVELFA